MSLQVEHCMGIRLESALDSNLRALARWLPPAPQARPGGLIKWRRIPREPGSELSQEPRGLVPRFALLHALIPIIFVTL